MDRLNGKVAIIVGATSGIGEAMVKLFAGEGATVLFCGRREEKGEALEKEIRGTGQTAKFIRADATVKTDLERVVNYTADTYGKIDILCNNSGFGSPGLPTHENDIGIYDKTFDVNVKSYIMMSSLVIPHMLKAGKGSIVNTCSLSADQPLPNNAFYAASKGAVKQLTRSMAKEYAPHGIRVNCIQPGLTTTEMVPKGSVFEKAILPGIPLGRPAAAREIAQGALFLASDEASYCCGTCLIMDGGLW